MYKLNNFNCWRNWKCDRVIHAYGSIVSPFISVFRI